MRFSFSRLTGLTAADDGKDGRADGDTCDPPRAFRTEQSTQEVRVSQASKDRARTCGTYSGELMTTTLSPRRCRLVSVPFLGEGKESSRGGRTIIDVQLGPIDIRDLQHVQLIVPTATEPQQLLDESGLAAAVECALGDPVQRDRVQVVVRLDRPEQVDRGAGEVDGRRRASLLSVRGRLHVRALFGVRRASASVRC